MRTDFVLNDLQQGSGRYFLDAIFETVFDELQIWEAVYDNENNLNDFKLILNNNTPFSQNNLLLKSDTGRKYIFGKLYAVFQTNGTIDEIFYYPHINSNYWFRVKARKFGHYIVMAIKDITDFNELEQKSREVGTALSREKREAELLSIELKNYNTLVAHEFSESLRNVYTCLEFIISNDAKNLSDSGKANVRRAQAAVQKMKLLADDIVSLSNTAISEPLAKVDLNDLMKQVTINLQEKIEENHAIITHSDLPVIAGYPFLLTILFTHLIDNAIKFRKENLSPQILVVHSKEHIEISEDSAMVKEEYDVVSVEDNGIGLDVQDTENIFTMFYRPNERGKGKGKGSGVGLAICKKIMELHGGFIKAECTPECTTFKCFFKAEGNR